MKIFDGIQIEGGKTQSIDVAFYIRRPIKPDRKTSLSFHSAAARKGDKV
jgi:hypothetical protein